MTVCSLVSNHPRRLCLSLCQQEGGHKVWLLTPGPQPAPVTGVVGMGWAMHGIVVF